MCGGRSSSTTHIAHFSPRSVTCQLAGRILSRAINNKRENTRSTHKKYGAVQCRLHETHTSYSSSLTANKQEQMNNEPSPVCEMMRLAMISVSCNEVKSSEWCRQGGDVIPNPQLEKALRKAVCAQELPSVCFACRTHTTCSPLAHKSLSLILSLFYDLVQLSSHRRGECGRISNFALRNRPFQELWI